MDRKRLQELSIFLRGLPAKMEARNSTRMEDEPEWKFDMRGWFVDGTPFNCSTVGCAIGWATYCGLIPELEDVLFKGNPFVPNREGSTFVQIAEIYGFPTRVAHELFSTYGYVEEGSDEGDSVTPEMVADKIDALLREDSA